MKDTEEELFGPDTDLAISLSGILIVFMVSMFTLYMIVSSKFAEAQKENNSIVRYTNSLQEDNKANSRYKENFANLKSDFDTLTNNYNELEKKLKKTLEQLKLSKVQNAKSRYDAITKIARLDDQAELNRKRYLDASQTIKILRYELETQKNKAAAEKKDSKTILDKLQRTQNENVVLRKNKRQLELEKQEIAKDNRYKEGENNYLKREVRYLRDKIRNQKNKNDKPPIITISDEDVPTFESASAKVSYRLKQRLEKQVISNIRKTAERYQAFIIEIIGHTDEVQLGDSSKKNCNIDDTLLEVLNQRKNIEQISSCDNISLGMARAAAIAVELRKLGLSEKFTILPLSAGPTILTNGKLAKGQRNKKSEAARRRIEIRMRREINK